MKEIYEEATNQSKMVYEAQKEEIFNNTLKENKKLKQEIERLTAESTKWESKFYDEAKKVDKAIEFIIKNENNISSIKDLENGKTYNSALLYVKSILQESDKE